MSRSRETSLHMLENPDCFGEPHKLVSHSFTWISKIVFGLQLCFTNNTAECHFDLYPEFTVICVKYTLKHRTT